VEVRVGSTLGDAVNLFRCCILTWRFFTIVLPAFLIAGAVVVFVPNQSVMRLMGAKANRFLAYGVSSISGNVLTVCSCNVVPIFSGILRRGAGIGPAFTFVFAAPAIHIVNTIVTWGVIGPRLALWRLVAVPIIAIGVGLSMAFLFRHEERANQADTERKAVALVAAEPGQARKAVLFVGVLMTVLLLGASINPEQFHWVREGLGGWIMVPSVLVALGLTGRLAWRLFAAEEAKEWLRQTYLLLRQIIPIFILAVIVIAIIVQRIPITWIMPTAANASGLAFGHPHGNRLLPVFLSAVFSTVMYFPMLTEVAFVKGLLIEKFALGPALAMLLGGPGLSLPGLILVSRIAGWKKTVVYWVVMVLMITAVSYLFGHYMTQYMCPCQERLGESPLKSH
jgi:uncharacterized membrane protein YraQ (UPF0718 family)